MKSTDTKPMSQFTFRAEEHWRRSLPRMVAELEKKGQLQEALREAEERTAMELDDLRRHFLQQGLNQEQAYQTAWEIIRERYVFLRPES